MLGMLRTAYVRGLGPYWRNSICTVWLFFKQKLYIRSKVFRVNLVTESSESMRRHVSYIPEQD
jgi:hypothetical protein